jgi:hypothetical protein
MPVIDAKAEREATLGDQREGTAKAKREGRVPTARRQAAEIARLNADGVTPSEIASRLGIGRPSVYRVLGKQAAGDQVACPQQSNARALWENPTWRPGFISIAGGAFVDSDLPAPTHSVWEDRKYCWISIPADEHPPQNPPTSMASTT